VLRTHDLDGKAAGVFDERFALGRLRSHGGIISREVFYVYNPGFCATPLSNVIFRLSAVICKLPVMQADQNGAPHKSRMLSQGL
jgi:hypothetical protein